MAAAAAPDRGFYRSPERVAILAIVAPVGYELWWLWQLFAFTRRERFPRARAFWWILVPIYNYVVIYRQFDDIAQKVAAVAAAAAFNATVAIWLFVGSSLIGNVSTRINGLVGLALFVLSGVLLAAAFYPVQRGANAYQEVQYPGRSLIGMTVGEWIATAIGVVLFLLVILGSLQPA